MPRRTRSSRRTTSRRKVTLMSRTALRTLAGVTEHQLTIWEREELVTPIQTEESPGRGDPLYDVSVLRRIKIIRTLAEDLDVNIPGIDVILRLLDELSSQRGC